MGERFRPHPGRNRHESCLFRRSVWYGPYHTERDTGKGEREEIRGRGRALATREVVTGRGEVGRVEVGDGTERREGGPEARKRDICQER
jgi:hypothetical protein